MQRERARIEDRRAFIQAAAVLGASTWMPCVHAATPRSAGSAPRVAVVGAGLAGLSAARALRQSGVGAIVFEAAPRAGGRCWSERGAFADGQIAERGGELVDTSHDAMIDLALDLGLSLDDLAAAEKPGTRAAFHFGGSAYDERAVVADFRALWPALERDARAVANGYPTFRRYTPAQRTLDRLSCAQWIERRVSGGLRSRFGQLLANAYTEELGGDPEDISAISVVGLLAGSPQDAFSPYAESDQRYHIRGGNDLVVQRLVAGIEPGLRTAMRLVALAALPDGCVRLTFARDQALVDEVFDRVIVAIPFTLLRDVDLERARFGTRKLACIRELGMGRNTKLQLQFSDRAWLAAGINGETRGDGSYQVSWEVTRAQSGAAGILNFYSGGSTAARAGDGTPEERARAALADVERVLPSVGAMWNGRVIRNAWDRHPWTKGSYSLLGPGQYTSLHGIEDSREGSVHFAGEHTSMDFAGYMNGAVESGQRAAAEVMRAVRMRGTKAA